MFNLFWWFLFIFKFQVFWNCSKFFLIFLFLEIFIKVVEIFQLYCIILKNYWNFEILKYFRYLFLYLIFLIFQQFFNLISNFSNLFKKFLEWKKKFFCNFYCNCFIILWILFSSFKNVSEIFCNLNFFSKFCIQLKLFMNLFLWNCSKVIEIFLFFNFFLFYYISLKNLKLWDFEMLLKLIWSFFKYFDFFEIF